MTKSGDRARLRQLAREWILPPAVSTGLRRVAGTVGTRLMARDQRDALASNARLQGTYVGRRCFVLGNGPSLADVNIEALGGEVTVVMNHFNQHPAIKSWQPTVHCVAEPASAYGSPASVEFLRGILEGYSSTTHVFPIELKPFFERTSLLPPERVAFVRQDGRRASDFDEIDLTKAVPMLHDTSILAVSVAIAMGCNPIILLGLDYNWLSHRSINRHFYEELFARGVEDMAQTPYLEVMRSSIPCWEAHGALHRIGARGGQVIVNATAGSFLDAYPSTGLPSILT